MTEQTVGAQCLLDTQSVAAHHCLVLPLVAWTHQKGAEFEHRLLHALIILPCKIAKVSPSTRTAYHNAAGSWGLELLLASEHMHAELVGFVPTLTHVWLLLVAVWLAHA